MNQDTQNIYVNDEVIMTFNIKIGNNNTTEVDDQPENDEIRSVGITELNYTEDELGGSFVTLKNEIIDLSDKAETPIATETDDNDKIDNPKTGYKDIIILLVIISLVSGLSIYFIKNKELIKNI